jgi:hypothetical protein
MKRILAAVVAALGFAATALAKPEPPCPRVQVEFERCNPGDRCHRVFVHPSKSPDARFEQVGGTLHLFIRENGGTGTEWETIGHYNQDLLKWESLFGFDLYDRVRVTSDLCE